MPTDPIANELSIRLFLFGLGFMSIFEGLKLGRPYSFVVWGCSFIFFLAGLLVTPLMGLWPIGVLRVSQLASSPVSWFILAILAYLALRPFWLKLHPEASSQPTESLFGPRLTSIEKRLETQPTSAQISAIKDLLSLLKTRVDLIESTGDDEFKELQSAIVSLGQQIAALHTKHVEAISQVERLIERTRETADSRFGNVDLGFQAILNREWHLRIFSDLRDQFENLRKPIASGERVSDWTAWRATERTWRAKLEQWLVIANYYSPNTAAAVMSIPDDEYYGEWTFDESALEGADNVKLYKELHILWSHAREVRARVDKAIEHTAFSAPSRKGRIDPPPSFLNQLMAPSDSNKGDVDGQ